jgi:hypothetical protein
MSLYIYILIKIIETSIDDGISKLILLAYSNNTLQFTINDTEPDNLTN